MMLFLAAFALAHDDEGAFHFDLPGDVRYIASFYPDYPVDALGTEANQPFLLDQRYRLGLSMGWTKLKLVTEWDFFSGTIAGDPWSIPGNEDERERYLIDTDTRGRKLELIGQVGPVQASAGLTTSYWGLGMIANDGAHEPFFGRSDFGDRVLRLRLSTRPGPDSPLSFSLIGDRVLADDTAKMANDQVVWQGIGAAMYAHPNGRRAGLYGVYRHQTEPNGRVTEAGVLDLYSSWPIQVGDWMVVPAMELAGIMGTTDRSLSYNAREELKIASAGATGQVKVARGKGGGVLRAGWASGDGDPDDGVTHDFTFDRDFDVGMFLFDEYSAAIEAGTYALLTDPSYSGQPPDGVETIVTEGAFRRASFVQPIAEWRPGPKVSLRGGVLLAWSSAPVSQAFYTYRNGGVPVNAYNQPTEGYSLGTELDWALVLGNMDGPGMSLLLQGAHMMPSENLAAGGLAGRLDFFTFTGRWKF